LLPLVVECDTELEALLQWFVVHLRDSGLCTHEEGAKYSSEVLINLVITSLQCLRLLVIQLNYILCEHTLISQEDAPLILQ
jgi:hypothetical protein